MGLYYTRKIIMSEKLQRNAANMRLQMSEHYDDGIHHKHNKNHLAYRQHWRTYPVQKDSHHLHTPAWFLLHSLLNKRQQKKARTRVHVRQQVH